jgi:hypothetical protein
MSIENEPAGEAAQIAHIVELTLHQMKRRYENEPQFLRGVHPKDHGCVKATFIVRKDLPRHLQRGLFTTPGKEYDAWIRFSNADPRKRDDSVSEPPGTPRAHGSRGMAIKVLNVSGERLLKEDKTEDQDFLMINQQTFAFDNVADYEVLSEVIADNDDNVPEFFGRQKKNSDLEVQARAGKTFETVGKIRGTLVKSPVETRYFSAAPFLFGTSQVMKYSVTPTSPASAAEPDLNDSNYLRKALATRLKSGSPNVTFDFQVQLQDACEIESDVDRQIESAHTLWPGESFPFETLATITIEPQDIDAKERVEQCEKLVFNPWQGIKDHQPLGGINRLRKAVYPASSERRLRT